MGEINDPTFSKEWSGKYSVKYSDKTASDYKGYTGYAGLILKNSNGGFLSKMTATDYDNKYKECADLCTKNGSKYY